MAKRCGTHNIIFSWTCPACEEALRYVGRPSEHECFNQGFRGGSNFACNLAEEAAYEHGIAARKSLSGSESKHISDIVLVKSKYKSIKANREETLSPFHEILSSTKGLNRW